MDKEEEKELIKSIKKGKLEEFEKIVNEYQKPLLGTAYYFVGNKDDAQELCQEAFLKLFKYIKSFLPKRGSLKSYLYKTIANLCYSHLNKRKNKHSEIFEENLQSNFDREEKGEIANIINSLLKFLNPKERIVFVLREVSELEYNEIAKMLKLNEVTIRRYNSMAKQKLRELIEKKYPEYNYLYEKD